MIPSTVLTILTATIVFFAIVAPLGAQWGEEECTGLHSQRGPQCYQPWEWPSPAVTSTAAALAAVASALVWRRVRKWEKSGGEDNA